MPTAVDWVSIWVNSVAMLTVRLTSKMQVPAASVATVMEGSNPLHPTTTTIINMISIISIISIIMDTEVSTRALPRPSAICPQRSRRRQRRT